MGRGENDNDEYNPPHPESDAAAALSDSDPAILYAFRGKEAVVTVVGYTKIVFAVFAQGYLLVLVYWFWYWKICGILGGS